MAKNAIPKIGLRATAGKRTLRFGMVAVGVSLAPALDDKARVSGRFVDPDDHTPVKQQYVNDAGDVVKPVRGFEYGDGFVVFDNDEAAALKAESEDVIDLVANVESDEVPAEWVDKTYLCWPTDATHNQAYALVAGYLRGNDRVFVGTTVANGTTKALAIRWSDVYDCLIAQQMSYHEQVRWSNVEMVAEGVAAIPAPDAAMAAMAEQVFGNLPAHFGWDEVEDEYGERLLKAIAEKGEAGKVTTVASAADAPAPPDLMAALAASIEANAGRKTVDRPTGDRGGLILTPNEAAGKPRRKAKA